MKKEQANFRIDADAKSKAYEVLAQIGIKPTDAVNMLMRHIAMFGELPFHPRIPNVSKNPEDYNNADEIFGKISELMSNADMYDK